MFKRIISAFRKIVPKKYKTLNQAIMDTPENTKKEIKIAKVGRKYQVINDNRQEGAVWYSEETLRKVFPKKRSKLIHTHTNGIKELPSANDITNMISHYIRYNKDFEAISVMDAVNGKESGRIGIMLTKEAKEYVKKNFDYDTLDDLDELLDSFRYHIEQRLDRIFFETNKILSAKGLSDSSPEYKKIRHNTIKKIMYKYYKDSLKLKLKFVPQPGYKFNKETMAFEKIK
jgi:hypothetical protein